MDRRRGFTLIELLVVIGILVMLVGLTLAGVQRVRAAAARTACANNLRQVGLAAQNYHGTHGRFPSGVRGLSDPQPCLTWLARLLPHLEQQVAWGEAVEDYERQRLFSQPIPHRNLARPLPVFLCPSDGQSLGTTEDGVTAAFTYYLGVTGGAGQAWNGVLYRDSQVRQADLADGASSTLFAGERPPSADVHFGWWYAGIGQSMLDGSADSVIAAREFNRTYRAPTCPLGPYSFGPGTRDNLCDMFHFWSFHTGGGNFLFADCSVRFLNYSVDNILPALATRAGGETVGPLD